MKILIVDDSLVNRFTLEKLLKDYGNCNCVMNGAEAVLEFLIAIEEGKPYDIIFMNTMMPIMDAKEALKLIRKKGEMIGVHASKVVKIVLVTDLDLPNEVIDEYYQDGCTSFLVKPIDENKLVTKMQELSIVKR